MKRSASVNAGLLAALAWTLTGCGDDNNAHLDQNRRCVNDQNIVVDQRECDDRHGGGIGHWYYGGGGVLGGPAYGGGVQPPATSKSSDNGSVSRGGFGTTGGGGTSAGS